MGLGAADFYVDGSELALQQGDILIVPVTRVSFGALSPSQWQTLDQELVPVIAAQDHRPEVRSFSGWSLAMVTTHDCGLDKEFNVRLKQLEEEGEDATEDLLTSIEDDDELDRFLQVSPLVEPGAVKQAGVVVDQVPLLAGTMVGYLPVPELVVGEEQLVPAAIVDLNYRATIDRLTQVTRVTSISDAARTQLRYVLARTDALRTPTLEFELSSIIGKTITKARVSKRNPLTVELTLNDETKIALMQVPGSPSSGGPARTSRSADPGQRTPQ